MIEIGREKEPEERGKVRQAGRSRASLSGYSYFRSLKETLSQALVSKFLVIGYISLSLPSSPLPLLLLPAVFFVSRFLEPKVCAVRSACLVACG